MIVIYTEFNICKHKHFIFQMMYDLNLIFKKQVEVLFSSMKGFNELFTRM